MMKTIASLALVAALFAGCGGAIPPTAGPSPTPIIVYVTPSPTPSPSPTRVPTPTLAVTLAPTMTSDDAAIAQIIRDGATKLLGLAEDLQNGVDTLGTMEAIHTFAKNQQTVMDIHRGSICTQPAVALYGAGLGLTEQGSQDFLDWYAGGAIGDFDNSDFGAGATKVGEAVRALNESAC